MLLLLKVNKTDFKSFPELSTKFIFKFLDSIAFSGFRVSWMPHKKNIFIPVKLTIFINTLQNRANNQDKRKIIVSIALFSWSLDSTPILSWKFFTRYKSAAKNFTQN